MRLILFRHTERENLGTSNPPLSRRGIQQAENIARRVLSKNLPSPSKLYASPRLRAQMTLTPLNEQMKIGIQILPELDERLNSESAVQFTTRVKLFLSKCEVQEGTLYLCTHLDWIEEALCEIPSNVDLLQAKFQSWSPGQFMHFKVEEGLWQFEDFGRIDVD